MKRKLAALFFAVAVIGMIGCSDSGSSSGNSGIADVRGTWNGTGNYVHNNVPVTKFNVNLGQTGNAVSGNYVIDREPSSHMSGSISGSVSGSDISLTMHPHGYASGTVSGNSMSLTWTEPGFGGASWPGNKTANVLITR